VLIDNIIIASYAISFLVSISLLSGLVLGVVQCFFTAESNPLVDQINAILPQTQCGQCGHPGCKPYAQAIANGKEINLCPPGGQETVDNLAKLLGVEATTVRVSGKETGTRVAVIDESQCIGCTKCIQACPVDAIVGVAKMMHTVIADYCTGCDLCIEPCPVDCIDMITVATTPETWKWPIQLNKAEIIVEDA
jgi:electron transport complex protein RnfB